MVLQFGISPNYVLDEMQFYEISALMKYSYLRSKDGWEQTRLLAYMAAQTHSTKKLKLEDIIKFDWEKESTHQTKSAEVTTAEEIEFLQNQADELGKLLFGDNSQQQ